MFNEPPITVTWKGIVDAVLNYRYCAFLWFLQFLILFVVISPLIYLLISNRYMGIVAIVLVLVIDSTGICGDLAFGGVQAQAFCNWLFIYMTGGYIGVHGSSAVESKNTSWLLLLASTILAVLAYYFFKHSPSMFTNLMYLLLFASALWCLICKLPLPMAASWQKHTFMAVSYTHLVQTEEEIRERVKGIFNDIIVERAQKLVIFIDELDRCRPSFAIEMLERIKHYFDDELSLIHI